MPKEEIKSEKKAETPEEADVEIEGLDDEEEEASDPGDEDW
jgi:hypothetical protein